MNKITVDKIVEGTNGKLLCGNRHDYITGVKHDSRECAKGDMFVAVMGENIDGHKYINSLIGKGIKVFLVSKAGEWIDEAEEKGISVICVEDTVFALGQLAKYYLSTLDLVRIAVTGSVGKTSVRDMVYYVINEKYKCGRNIKNYNNNIGLPLSIFRLDDSYRAAVLEIGMNHFGEIDRLGEIIKPHIAIISNIGVAHIENLGSRDGIFNAKMEIAGHIVNENGKKGTLIFASDDKLTKERTGGDYHQISVGSSPADDYIISEVDDRGIEGIKFTLGCCGEVHRIALPVPGRHNAINAALAISAGSCIGLLVEVAAKGLSKVELTGRRLRILRGNSVKVIDDTYNANPDSMKSALKVLDNSQCIRRVAILGDMYELGDESLKYHADVGQYASQLNIDLLIAVGNDAKAIAHGAEAGSLTGSGMQIKYFSNKDDLFAVLEELILPEDTILVKGSRGMKMEEVTEKLLEY